MLPRHDLDYKVSKFTSEVQLLKYKKALYREDRVSRELNGTELLI